MKKIILFLFMVSLIQIVIAQNLISGNKANSVLLTSSNLPLFIINTNGQTINDEPKIMADMGVIYNGEGKRNNITDLQSNYNGKIMIEIRGSSSQQFPKKQYGFTTVDATGADLDVPLLGLPSEHTWPGWRFVR